MKHIVKLLPADMVHASVWQALIFSLDPAATATDVKSIELTVESVFFQRI